MALAAALIAAPSFAHAQAVSVTPLVSNVAQGDLEAGKTIVVGQVIDSETGRPISSALVRAEHNDRNGAQTSVQTVTTEEGRFLLAGVPTGDVNITVNATGYNTRTVHVKLSVRYVAVDMALSPLNVNNPSSLSDSDSSQSATTLH